MVADLDPAVGGAGGSPKAAGWYPDRTSATDQSYWDGQAWTGKRRWTAGGWVLAGDAPEDAGAEPVPATAGPGPRYSAKPYAPSGGIRRRSTGFTLNLGLLLLLVCGIALMYGSVSVWIHVAGNVSLLDFHISVNGIDPDISTLISVNGWATFIGGILLVIFACFEMTSEEVQLSIYTTVIAAATAIFAIYDMFRIVQKVSQVPAALSANVSVGWGLICVLSAAVLALLISLVRLLQR
jgi:fluoride ion exporter CrcB/FEX